MTPVYDENRNLLYVGNPALCSERRPIGAQYNFACATAEEVIRRALADADAQSNFYHCYVVAAWGRINGQLVDPVGVLRADRDKIWFSFFNRGGIDFAVSRENPQDWAQDIVDALNRGRTTAESRSAETIVFPRHDRPETDQCSTSYLEPEPDPGLVERMAGRIFR